jgi:hypothetical protein
MVGNNEVNRNFWAKRQVDQQVDQHVMSYPRDPCSHRHSTRMADDSCTRPPVGRADNLWPCRNTTAVVSRMSKTFSRNQRHRLVCVHPQTVLSTLLFRLDELPVFAVTRAHCLGRSARDPSSRPECSGTASPEHLGSRDRPRGSEPEFRRPWCVARNCGTSSAISTVGTARAVGITKAVKLVPGGGIGPAFDAMKQ